jgi:hypothetical protein
MKQAEEGMRKNSLYSLNIRRHLTRFQTPGSNKFLMYTRCTYISPRYDPQCDAVENIHF